MKQHSDIFKALGFACDPNDGGWRWYGPKPNEKILRLVEKIPLEGLPQIPTKTESDLAKLLTPEQIASLVEFQNTIIRELRAAEYPPIGDQLDSLFHAGLFPTEMAARLTAVKAKYPTKGEKA